MAGNTFGNIFKVTTCGESHGGYIAAIVDGCPSGFQLQTEDIQRELDRRKPGQTDIVSPRQEKDCIEILSGVFNGKTTGAPILLAAKNNDMKPEEYESFKHIYRPSHADFTYQQKYGIRDYRGSGRASARETLARVAAGAIAKKYLSEKLNIEILSYVEQIGEIKTSISHNDVTAHAIDSTLVRCPDKDKALAMEKIIHAMREAGDSVGGIIKCIIRRVPVGLGEPVFDKLPADLAKAMLSINAVKGFEFGSGFSAATMRGSEHNDVFIANENKISCQTNFAGGTLGGISTGEDIYFRVAFKPVATIAKEQTSVTMNAENISFAVNGRHDACVLPRAVPIVDAMSAIVLMDHYLRQQIYVRQI